MPANGKRVSIATLGCKVNQYDTNVLAGALAESGFEIVAFGEPADVAIVNTCTVTALADKKSRALIRQAARMGSDVCVCGCLAERDAETLLKMEEVAAVVPMDSRERIVQIVAGLTGTQAAASPGRLLRVAGPRLRTRGFLTIQEGCSSMCTYCVIPYVRGRARSRPEDAILKDAAVLAEQGVQELILSGTHISSYGLDNGANLAELLRKLSEMDGIRRLRLGSLEPWLLNAGMVEELAAVPNLCPHFHISLQSGCSATLKAMNRHYTAEEYAERVSIVRAFFDNPAVTTDVMTGFPGETIDAFEESLAFVRRMQFAKLHVFPYSERDGTPAASMDGFIPVNERRKRAQQMLEAGREAQDAYQTAFLDTTQTVLFDRTDREGASGYTDRYVRVYVPGVKAGDFSQIRLTRREDAGYEGVPAQPDAD